MTYKVRMTLYGTDTECDSKLCCLGRRTGSIPSEAADRYEINASNYSLKGN